MQQRIHFLFSYVIAAFGQPKGAVQAAPYNQIGENENGINCNDPTAKAEQFGFGIPGRQNRFHKRGHRGPSLCETLLFMSPQRKTAPCARTAPER
jgi:hypothetical protein